MTFFVVIVIAVEEGNKVLNRSEGSALTDDGTKEQAKVCVLSLSPSLSFLYGLDDLEKGGFCSKMSLYNW